MHENLNISIEDHKKIQTLQMEFNTLFPFLKLEFFTTSSSIGAKKMIKSSMATLGECRFIHTSGTLEISPGMTVAELETTFLQQYGLNAQVFRKSGRVWLETSVTDKWSLEKQNWEGEELSKHFLSDNRNPE